jgi:hypothetical protein
MAKIARMSMTRVLATLFACVFALTALSCSSPSSPKFALKAAEKRGRLEGNGLRFVIMPDESTQLAEVDIRYDVGAREDPPGRAGLAHLVEHMMFQTRPDGPNTPPIFQTILDLATDMNAWPRSIRRAMPTSAWSAATTSRSPARRCKRSATS